MRSEPAQIARDLDRDYEAVLDFVHEVLDTTVKSENLSFWGCVKPTRPT
jgi:hypothetical protein